DGYDDILSYFDDMHQESVALFKSIRDERLKTEIMSLDGRTIELGNFLRALIVHEVHHRGALCIYLNLLGVETPPIIGLKEEEVIELSRI
ncbi:MAG TPA: DinB family protein, partial [Catalimonadaceae bacterium]|nr:DinB family protein [Catalimonadaceae bacterium]